MKLLVICPTYGRPKMVANTIALFQAQDYPKDQCKLLILDDAGQYEPQFGENWTIVSTPDRFESMPRKYEALLLLEQVLGSNPNNWDGIVIWDDDEIYLPNHLQCHAEILENYPWSYPPRVYCLYNPITIERTGGNMWASTAARVDLLKTIKWDKWFVSKEDAFDCQYLNKLRSAAIPGCHPQISFMFRWETGMPHLQWFCGKEGSTQSYQKFPKFDGRFVKQVVPKFDAETEKILGMYMRKELPL
jgi:hypothetical protein